MGDAPHSRLLPLIVNLMAEKGSTPPPTTTTAVLSSSPATPPAKRTRMSSADTSMRTEPKQEDKVASEQPQVAETQQAESASNTEGTAVAPEERPPADQRVEIV